MGYYGACWNCGNMSYLTTDMNYCKKCKHMTELQRQQYQKQLFLKREGRKAYDDIMG